MGEQEAARIKERKRDRKVINNRGRSLRGGERRRGLSSAGRAPALQAGGREFESLSLHSGREPEKEEAAIRKKKRGLIAQPVRAHA